MSSSFDKNGTIQLRLLGILEFIYQNNRFYGPGLLNHAALVAAFASATATEMGGNGPVAYIGGWLHDIGAAMKGPEDHHKTGAEISRKILKGVGYPEEVIEPVSYCLLTHRGSIENSRKTIEAKCVASADGLVHFFRVSDLFWVALFQLGLGSTDAGEWVGNKLERSWNKMLPQHQALVEKYGRAGMRGNLDLLLDRGRDKLF